MLIIWRLLIIDYWLLIIDDWLLIADKWLFAHCLYEVELIKLKQFFTHCQFFSGVHQAEASFWWMMIDWGLTPYPEVMSSLCRPRGRVRRQVPESFISCEYLILWILFEFIRGAVGFPLFVFWGRFTYRSRLKSFLIFRTCRPLDDGIWYSC